MPFRKILTAAVILTALSHPAEACKWGRRHRAAACRPPAMAYYPAPVAYQCAPAPVSMPSPQGYAPAVYAPAPMPQAAPMAVAVAPVATQPAGEGSAGAFMAWLNQTRAAHGLPAVGWDPGMEAICAENNRCQAARGLGHFILGHARAQNSAQGAGFPGVEAMWMNSASHRSALLNPMITRVGIAWYGEFCTFSAN